MTDDPHKPQRIEQATIKAREALREIDRLRVRWRGKADDGDLQVHFPLGSQTKSDGGYLVCALVSIVEELERRGYDKTTIKFSIERPSDQVCQPEGGQRRQMLASYLGRPPRESPTND